MTGEPEMVTITHQAIVQQDPGTVWNKVGGFFDLGRFLDVACLPLLGDGQLGSLRRVGEAIIEALVGTGPQSYTYVQTHGPMSGHCYHGCVSGRAAPGGGCELSYAIVYDQSGIPDERRESERERLTARFGSALAAMARLAAE